MRACAYAKYHSRVFAALKVSFIVFSVLISTTFTTDAQRDETFVLVVTNNGEAHAFGVHNVRRYLHERCMPPTDVHAILSTVLTKVLDVRFCFAKRFVNIRTRKSSV